MNWGISFMNKEKETFEYTYSSKRKEEIENIRSKYVSKEEDKMELLRKLDKSVSKKATTSSILIGVIGSLVLGLGMSCCMVFPEQYFIPGIMIGLVGMIIVGCAYPIYLRIYRKQKELLAPQIIALADELSKE